MQQRLTGPDPRPPEAAEVLAALERILASSDFDASPRSRAFLRFVVEETLAGRQGRLTQDAIAVRVFGRREDFDPTVDPIVRIQAGRLRRSLERYYLLGGADDPVRLELPRGSYVPAASRAVPRVALQARARATPPTPEARGWPTIDVGVRPGGEGEGTARQLLDHLAIELDRYRDVHVVLQGGDFGLTVRVLEDEGPPRIAVRLVERRTGWQLWAEEYRESAEPAAAFCRETSRVVAARVASESGIVAQTLCARALDAEADATVYGAILRSYRFFLKRDPSEFGPALEALCRAVAAEPECALAWVQLSRLHVANHAFEIAPADTSIEQGLAFAQNAVRLDPSSQRARAVQAFALLVKGELAAGRTEAEAALALNPETFVYLETIAWLLCLLGDWGRGLPLARRAIARNPHHMPAAHHALWADHLRHGAFDSAYEEALLYRDTGFFWRSLMRAASLGHLGRPEDARADVAELLRSKPDFARRGRALVSRLHREPDLQERIAEGLAMAGLALD